MIVAIVVIESIVARNWLVFTDPVSLSWRFSAEAVATGAADCEFLCLGDSLVKHGLIPGVIEEVTGRRTRNVSAARAPALLTYFLLRRALDAGARPEAMIINAKPAVLMAGPGFNARYWQEVVNPRECVELSRVTGDGSFVLSIIVGRLLPSVRNRLEMRSNLTAAIHGNLDPLVTINRVLWRNWSVNGGANIAAAQKRGPDEAISDAEIERRLHPGVFHVDPTNADALDRLISLAADREIPVFWLLPPLSSDLQGRRDRSGSEARYEQFIRSFTVRYPKYLTVLDARRGTHPPSMFADHTHLNGDGAVALSRAVATAIRSNLAVTEQSQSAQWLTLADPLDNRVASNSPLEDLEQSKLSCFQIPTLREAAAAPAAIEP